jgi:hypothetical protein
MKTFTARGCDLVTFNNQTALHPQVSITQLPAKLLLMLS